MSIFTNDTFTGHYPVGCAAVVVADTPEQAAERLNEVLRQRGLLGDALPESMKLFPNIDDAVRIINDGNY